MKQLSLASGFELSGKRTRKRVFLEEMDRVVPWAELVALIEPHYSGKSATGRPPFVCELMLRIHFLVIEQQFGHRKVRYRGLARNTAQIITLFALSNLWMARRRLLATG